MDGGQAGSGEDVVGRRTPRSASLSAPLAVRRKLVTAFARTRGALRKNRTPSTISFALFDALRAYDRTWLSSDLVAGLVVAIMLVPQAMAYAMLAGLPPHVGLYASLLPLFLYALMGSSNVLAVGPVALVSLMVASALTPFAQQGSPEYVAMALLLAAMSGLSLLALGVLKFGFVINFISQPVISGFVTAAALIIGLSQVPHLTGIAVPGKTSPADILSGLLERRREFNPVTFVIGGASLVLLLAREQIAASVGRLLSWSAENAGLLARAMPLVATLIATFLTARLDLAAQAGVKIVGYVPTGLPTPTLPSLDPALMKQLLPAALLIAVVGFLESVSIAKSLASKRRQRINPNQELAGLGLANVGAALTGGYPVAGSFSRSAVAFASGARTPVAGLVTLAAMLLALLLLMPLLHELPMAVLAAIIIMAAVQLMDFSALKRAWTYSKVEGACGFATFAAVLVFGVVNGIMIGIALSLALHLWRTSRPHIAILGQIGDGNLFRSIKRFQARTFPGILLVRIDENLYFANAAYLEDTLLRLVAQDPSVRHVVVVCTSVNFIDASAAETLEGLIRRLKESGVTLHFAGMKLRLRDRLRRLNFERQLAPGLIFLSTDAAVRHLTKGQG